MRAAPAATPPAGSIVLAAPSASALAPDDAPLPPDRNPLLVYLRSRNTENTRKAMLASLNACAGALRPGVDAYGIEWHKLRYQHAEGIRSVLQQHYKPASVNRHLAALRGIAKQAYKLDLMPVDAFTRIKMVEDVPDNSLLAGRYIPQEEIVRLYNYVNSIGPVARRARAGAILALAHYNGMRRDEIASLQMGNWFKNESRLRFYGKGKKEREIPTTKNCASYIERWLDVRGRTTPGPLITHITEDGARPVFQPITGDRIYNLLLEMGQKAGIPRFTPHDLRRTWASDRLDEGADISAVKEMMGHADVATTMRYDRRGYRAKEKVVANMNDIAIPRPPEQANKWSQIAHGFIIEKDKPAPPPKTKPKPPPPPVASDEATDEDFKAGMEEDADMLDFKEGMK